ncbi:hypothetical protein QFC19_001349 [Naganishia cerealis]|uniref:Uncharacterized protein n=1 Tax=Naganishia cerealis TaxID=610337 RepID=A0ACC2WHL6_9TREE|nr:hypothetical protein QFC19_001349 [Naganishia cerealis]
MKALRRSLNSDRSHHSQPSATHVSSPSLTRPSTGGQPRSPPPHHPASSSAALPSIPASARVAPPQKVIKAMQTHRSDIPMIMSYERGDFFYVTGELPADEKCSEGWYQALSELHVATRLREAIIRSRDLEAAFHAPISRNFIKEDGRRRRLPAAAAAAVLILFREYPQAATVQDGSIAVVPLSARKSKLTMSCDNLNPVHYLPFAAAAAAAATAGGATSAPLSRQASQQPSLIGHNPSTAPVSAPPSMLDGNVSAKSDPSAAGNSKGKTQPFVAKPIGRLGGPGLIPVSFVEIRDPVTSRPIENVEQILKQGQVQRIEEWKSATARYKESSIPLGSLGDFRNVGVGGDGFLQQGRGDEGVDQQQVIPSPLLMNGDIISTHVKSFHYEANAYWFRINALFLPDDPQAPAISLVLYRLYEDFYNFQITLLDLFPREAGRTTRASDVSRITGNRKSASGYSGTTGRILPYMPGPCDRVDVDITNERRKELDLYLYELLELRSHGGGYILRHDHVLGFFTPGSGDMTDTLDREEAITIAKQVAEAGAAAKRAIIAESHSRGSSMRQSVNNATTAGLDDRMSAIRLTDGDQHRSYSQQAHSRSASVDHSQQDHDSSHSVIGARIPGAAATSPVQRTGIPQTASSGNSFGRAAAGHVSTPSSAGGHNTTCAPSQSATAPQAAYIKIKILDRHTDDMVAVRVPPKVTYAQLLDKVRSRFFAEISVLQYRVGQGRIPGTATSSVDAGQDFGDVMDDRTLWEWLETHEKYVLYAE